MTKLTEVQRALELPAAEVAQQRGVAKRDVNKERFAAHLTSGMSVEDAGQAVGISHATAFRWAKDPEVKTLVKEWRSEVTDGLVRKLVRHGNVAIDTVVDIMQDAQVSAQTRLTAAFGVLDRLGVNPQALAMQGNEGTRVVIEQFLQLNLGDAAAAQQQRALLSQEAGYKPLEAIEGEFTID